MAKIEENTLSLVFHVFFRALKLYLLNFLSFIKYMFFPVIGSFIGISWLFFVLSQYSIYVENNFEKFLFLNNFFIMFLILLFLLIPGLIVFFRAFFDYLIAMVALNSAAKDLVATDYLVKDVKAYNEIINYREKAFFLLLLLLSFIYSILSFPPLFILLIIVFIYTALSLQAFALDDRFNAIDAIKRASIIVRGNALNTTILLFLCGLFSYLFIPELIYYGLNSLNIFEPTINIITDFYTKLPINNFILIPFNNLVTSFNLDLILTLNDLAKLTLKIILVSLIVGFLLPFRAIACTLWYKKLDDRNSTTSNSTVKKYLKRTKKQNNE